MTSNRIFDSVQPNDSSYTQLVRVDSSDAFDLDRKMNIPITQTRKLSFRLLFAVFLELANRIFSFNSFFFQM